MTTSAVDGKLQKRNFARRILQIDLDAFLPAIGQGEDRIFGLAFACKRVASAVADAGLLNLDDLGSEIGEPLRSDRARKQPRQIQNRDSVERLHARVFTIRRVV